ncbi:MAG: DUF4140 domain-containing protein [Deltaproteobacteria bacterium]|nr:DUF4140 domain-containing protein [Deltaproteobacteria bacterium]
MHTLPVQRVVLMEHRAQVERRGTVALSGTTVVEVPGVSLASVDRSLTVEVRGGTLAGSKLVRRWKEQPAGGLPADASELRRRVHALEHALEHERDAHEDAHALLRARAETVATSRAALLRAVASHAAVGTPDVAAWQEQLAAVTAQQADLDTALPDA